MINKNFYTRVIFLQIFLAASVPASYAFAQSRDAGDCVETQANPDFKEYDTEPFNLLVNKRSLIDGKNHFSQKISHAFDELLLKTSAIKSKKDFEELRQRLLSGPAPKPRFYKNSVTQSEYIFYEICQAHACNTTNLIMLYAPRSQSMAIRLSINEKVEFLEDKSASTRLCLESVIRKLRK